MLPIGGKLRSGGLSGPGNYMPLLVKRAHFIEGIENVPAARHMLFDGRNKCKLLLKVK